jgi:hypothetical protein
MVAILSGPAAEPTPASPPMVCRVRLLCLELRICRSVLSTHWIPIPLSCGMFLLLFQGRQPAFRRGSFALDHGSCLLALTLSLFSQTGDDAYWHPLPRSRSLLPRRGHHRVLRCLPHAWLIPRCLDFLFPPRLRPRVGWMALLNRSPPSELPSHRTDSQ